MVCMGPLLTWVGPFEFLNLKLSFCELGCFALLWIGLLPSEESTSREACSRESCLRVFIAEEGTPFAERRVWRWKQWLHHQHRRTMDGSIWDPVSYWKRIVWTGKEWNLVLTMFLVLTICSLLWHYVPCSAWPIAQLPNCPDAKEANCPDCENSRWWGRLWMLLIVYWNALSIEGSGKEGQFIEVNYHIQSSLGIMIIHPTR